MVNITTPQDLLKYSHLCLFVNLNSFVLYSIALLLLYSTLVNLGLLLNVLCNQTSNKLKLNQWATICTRMFILAGQTDSVLSQFVFENYDMLKINLFIMKCS